MIWWGGCRADISAWSLDCHWACWSTSGCSCCAVTLLAHCLQEVLWQRLGKIFEQLHLSAVTVWHLQRVLVKKRDPLTHVCFMDAYLATEETPLPSDAAWCVRVGLAVRDARSEVSVAHSLGIPSAHVAARGASCGSSAFLQASLKALGWFACLPMCSGAAVHRACSLLHSLLSDLSGVALSPQAIEDCKSPFWLSLPMGAAIVVDVDLQTAGGQGLVWTTAFPRRLGSG